MRLIILLLGILLFSCTEEQELKQVVKAPIDFQNVETSPSYALADSLAIYGLVSVQSIDSSILVDLRYATSNNFMGIVLYETIDDAYLQREVAVRLSECQVFLDSLKPGFKLKIYDAVRPVSIQKKMWDALDSIPTSERGKYVSNPKNRSVHNYGAAVDITIVDSTGKEIDMGAGYDDFRPIAFPSFETKFLESKELSYAQYANRVLLRKVMRYGKFNNIPSEWWHFNACSRVTAMANYKLLEKEPLKIVPKQ